MIYDLWHFFFPKPLAKVAKGFGLEKLEWDRANVTRDDLQNPQFEAYAVNDAILCEKIMGRMREAYLKRGVDMLATKTPAGLSMAAYKSQYLKAPMEQRDYSLRRLSMRANKGGIGEAFAAGTQIAPPGEVWQQWDADSLYPNAAIALQSLPLRTSDWHYANDEPPIEAEGICRVRFSFPDLEAYPCLPVVVKNGGMGFPLRGISYCTVAEARVAQSFGARIQWLQVYWYDPRRCDTSFQRYMRDMMAAKADADALGDEAARIVAKNLANTGIGKLSQRRRGLDIEDAKRLAEEMGMPLQLLLDPAMRLPEKSRQEPGESWCPEWHALILGKARALMWPLIRAVKSQVTSTDSVICLSSDARAAGFNGREVDQSRGKLGPMWFKLEGQGDQLTIRRQRLYVLEWQPLPGWGDGKDKVAHHAVHLNSRDSQRLIRNQNEPAKYIVKKKGTLRAAVQGTRAFGEFYTAEMTYDPQWGRKRALLPQGNSRPWKDAHEWEQALTA